MAIDSVVEGGAGGGCETEFESVGGHWWGDKFDSHWIDSLEICLSSKRGI